MTFADRAIRYAQQVVAGEVIACRYVKSACQRQLDDLKRSATDPAWPYRYDEDLANRVCAFMECLPHVEGEWAKPKIVDGVLVRPTIDLQDWDCFWFSTLFGWVSRETGLRRFRRAYLEVARKNAKSTKAAGTALYMLAADGEEGAQVYSAATKKDQAKIVWSIAQRMIERAPDFRALTVGYSGRSIYQTSTGSKYEPVGRDSDTLDGLNSHCFISDELHAQKDRGLYDVLDSSTGARAQPLGIGITTAGSNTAGVCYEQRTYLARILNATLKKHGGMGYRQDGSEHEDDTFFGMIYTLDHGYADKRPDDDWADPEVWIKANPNLGVSVSLDDMHAQCVKAKASPQSQGEFRTKRCNQWIAADSAWMDMTKWHACADPKLNEDQFKHEECYVALDAAFRQDLFAKIKLFRRGEDYYAFGKYWVPRPRAEEKGGDHYNAWAAQGLVTLSDGPVIGVDMVKDELRRDADLHVIREVPFDPAQLTQFAGEMLDEGFKMVEIRPTVLNFSEPMKHVSDLVLQGRLHHNGDPVLAWMIGNVVCHRDHKDNIYPNREHQHQKIDGAIALIMAMARAMAQAPQPEYQVFFA